MRILNYKIEGEMIRVTTDNKERPEFVYKVEKFDNKKSLMEEINKSINNENNKKDKKKAKKDKLIVSLDKKEKL